MALATAAGADPPAPARTEGDRTLQGIYTSGFQSGPQRLRAVFSPTGDHRWDVVFHFRWSGADRTYAGVASGNLTEGILHGRVRNEDHTRVFSFRCEFDKKRRCKGKHAEVVRTGEHETGTITLRE